MGTFWGTCCAHLPAADFSRRTELQRCCYGRAGVQCVALSQPRRTGRAVGSIAHINCGRGRLRCTPPTALAACTTRPRFDRSGSHVNARRLSPSLALLGPWQRQVRRDARVRLCPLMADVAYMRFCASAVRKLRTARSWMQGRASVSVTLVLLRCLRCCLWSVPRMQARQRAPIPE